MEFELEKLFSSYIKENQLNLELSYSMPPGYEDAFGSLLGPCL